MPPTREPPPAAPPGDGQEPAGVERWLAPYFRDPTLWPVLAVATASAVTGLASLLLLAAVDRSVYAAAALIAVGWMSVDVSLRERRGRGRIGLAGRALLALWTLALAAALAAR